ncbi:MAG: hypothetical protein KDI59_09165, partial [Xanthomonadales bacterium]|nr:hypothetical protein [Xanthomonadales bacterium]
AFQILLILVLLAHLSVYQVESFIIKALIYLVTFLTIASGFHYIYFWGKKAIVEHEKQMQNKGE